MKTKKLPEKAKPNYTPWILSVAAVLVIAVIVILSSQNASPTAAALPAEISVSQAAQKRDAGAFVLDVREPSEWNQFHIPGATLIPLAELPNRLKEVPKDREVVVVCRSGNRSQAGRDILVKAGYSQVTSMAGGVVDWQARGLPIVTGP